MWRNAESKRENCCFKLHGGSPVHRPDAQSLREARIVAKIYCRFSTSLGRSISISNFTANSRANLRLDWHHLVDAVKAGGRANLARCDISARDGHKIERTASFPVKETDDSWTPAPALTSA